MLALRISLILLGTAGLLLGPLAVLAQDTQWTCDKGPNDIVNAAQAAFDSGDLDQADALALQAQSVCASNVMRVMDAVNLAEQIRITRQSQETEQDPYTYMDLHYGPENGDPHQVLDIFLPEGAADPVPAVLIFHGSGQSRAEMYTLRHRLNNAGYGVITLDYRQDGMNTRSFLNDPHCALAWVQAKGGEYGIDTARLALYGYSLGGYLVSQTALIDESEPFMEDCPWPAPDKNAIKGVITGSAYTMAVSDIVAEGLEALQGSQDWFGLEPEIVLSAAETLAAVPPAEWRSHPEWSAEILQFAEVLPPYWVDDTEPPFLMLHAEGDTLVSVGNSQWLVAALEAAGNEATLLTDDTTGHIGIERFWQDALDFLAEVFAV